MINGKTIIAIIPARGGSKGLPGKNIKPLCGKPLIAWSIEACLGSRYLDEIMVTTDSGSIADVSLKYGASVPFIRPDDLSGDTVTSIDVIKHTLNYYYNELGKKFDYIALIEPTSPLRVSEDIDDAIEQLLKNTQAQAIVGVCKTESQNPAFLVKKNEMNFIEGYENSDMKVIRRQDVNDVYFFEGSIYVSQVDALLKQNSFYQKRTLAYEFPKWKSLEIDDIYDFLMVEALMKYKKETQ